ncbi:MAG: tryptophan synthase subunit alpha [Acidimicrobiia bacterium]
MIALEPHLRARRAAGAKLLTLYVTAGLTGWTDIVRAACAAGADAIEVGIPFSDPIMDGPVIQAASAQALQNGATIASILREVRTLDVDVPLVGMTYYNLLAHMGDERAANTLVESGISGMIVPDLPVDESAPWTAAADAVGLATVMLAAPTTTDARLTTIAARTRGFLYAVSLLGVTGERSVLADEAAEMGRRAQAVTDVPVLLGVGISTGDQAVQACQHADGVVIGSALMRRVLEGVGPDGVHGFVTELRSALDA